MVPGLSPNISIDKSYFNGKFRLGPKCKHSLCRLGKIADLRFSTLLEKIHLPPLWGELCCEF